MLNHCFYSYSREQLYGAYVYRTPDGTLVRLTNIRGSDAILESDEIYLGILPDNSKYVSHTLNEHIGNLDSVQVQTQRNELDLPIVKQMYSNLNTCIDSVEVGLTNLFGNMSLKEQEPPKSAIGTEDIWQNITFSHSMNWPCDSHQSMNLSDTHQGITYFS